MSNAAELAEFKKAMKVMKRESRIREARALKEKVIALKEAANAELVRAQQAAEGKSDEKFAEAIRAAEQKVKDAAGAILLRENVNRAYNQGLYYENLNARHLEEHTLRPQKEGEAREKVEREAREKAEQEQREAREKAEQEERKERKAREKEETKERIARERKEKLEKETFLQRTHRAVFGTAKRKFLGRALNRIRGYKKHRTYKNFAKHISNRFWDMKKSSNNSVTRSRFGRFFRSKSAKQRSALKKLKNPLLSYIHKHRLRADGRMNNVD
jgi:hypothetical protein